ncbi:MAG: hypothetical protein IPJ88_01785 [Myxococcales bacterium]|nr:MAG: hypothetical protein IPJ88_01785 [Myxococcales bacterium]
MNFTCFEGTLGWRSCQGSNKGFLVGGCNGFPLKEDPFDGGLGYRIQNCGGTNNASGIAKICVQSEGTWDYKDYVDVAAGYLN